MQVEYSCVMSLSGRGERWRGRQKPKDDQYRAVRCASCGHFDHLPSSSASGGEFIVLRTIAQRRPAAGRCTAGFRSGKCQPGVIRIGSGERQACPPPPHQQTFAVPAARFAGAQAKSPQPACSCHIAADDSLWPLIGRETLIMWRLILFGVAALFAVLHGLAGASADSYPQRAVRFILPFGPRAGVYITARMLAERLAARWGKPVVVENRPGGDGIVAINVFTMPRTTTRCYSSRPRPLPPIPTRTTSCRMIRSATCCRSRPSRPS